MGIMVWKQKCYECSRDITNTVKIECFVCQDRFFCISCFSKGIEKDSHKQIHRYRVIPPFSFKFQESNWTITEELLFVDGCENSGIGNWLDISRNIKTKTPLEVEKHFYNVYSNTEFDDGMCELFDTKQKSNPANHIISGYMPKRKSFEIEYENDIENKIKDIFFSETDTQYDVDLKKAVFDCYQTIIEKRKARFSFAEKWDLFESNEIQNLEKSLTRREKEFVSLIKPCSRFLTKKDFMKLVEGFLKEEKLKKEIRKLQEIQKLKHEAQKRKCLEKKPLSISLSKNYDLLSKEEKEFCSLTRIYPDLYFKYKNIIITESELNNGLRKKDARKLLKIDVNKTSKLYDFFISAGWIKYLK